MRHSVQAVLPVVASVTVLAACTTTFVAERVTSIEADMSSKGGVYYALPKTAIDISLPVRVTTFDSGELGSVLADCQLACAADALRADCPIPGPLPTRFALQRADVVARAKADLSNIYRVNVNAGWWQTIEHEFLLDDLGILTEGSSRGE